MYDFLVQNASTSAYLAAAFTVIGFIALFIFFAVGGVFGPINDLASVFQFLFLIPVALALHRNLGEGAPGLSLAVTVAVVLVMLAIAVMQSALVLGFVKFEQTLRPILFLGIVLGIWWATTGILALNQTGFPTGWAWTGIVTGISYIAIAIGFWIGGQQNPMAAVGFVVGAIASSVWTFWIASLLSSGPQAPV